MNGRIQTILAASLLLATSLPLSAQTVSGVVRDSESRESLPGAIIKLSNENGSTIQYKLTDKDGRFEIGPSSGAAVLTASLLGYSDWTAEAPLEESYEILLIASSEMIQESIVKANKVVMAGDTTKYNVMALKTRDDMVLGDVLKRIPGVEITSSGHVKVDGRDLGKFYVEGKDILSGNYNLATKNLNVDAIKSLEVIRGHQSVKILEGIKESEDSAINILLTDAARRKINWKGKASAGYAVDKDHFPISGELTAFWVSESASSVDVAEYDSQGNAMADITSTVIGVNDKQKSLDSKLSISPVSAPLDSKRALFNHDLSVKSVNTFSPSETSTLGFTAKYSNGALSSSSFQERSYQNENETTTISTTEERSERKEMFQGNLSYVNNISSVYVSEKLFADIGRSHGETLTLGDITRTLNSSNRTWDIGNRIGAQFRTGKSNVLGVVSYTQLSGFKEDLDVPGEELFQRISSSGLFEDLSLIGLTRSRNHFTFSVRPSLSYSLFNRKSDLSGVTEETVPGKKKDSSSASYLSTGISWEVSWDKGLLHMGTEGKLHHDIAKFRSYREGKLLLDASAFARYSSGRWEAKLSAGTMTSTPDIQQLGEVLFLTDYNTIHKGQESLSFIPSNSFGGSILYRDPIRGWNLRVNSNYTVSESLLGGRDISGNYIISYISDDRVPQKSWNSSLEATKGIYAINGNFIFRLSHIRLTTDFSQNGKRYGVRSDILSPSLEFNILPTSFWRLSGTGRMSLSSLKASGLSENKDTGLMFKVTNTFYLTSSLSAGTQTDFYGNSSTGKRVLFNDLFATWTKGHFRMKVMVNNLSNLKDYTSVSLSPLMETVSGFKIRPLTFMIGLDWTL